MRKQRMNAVIDLGLTGLVLKFAVLYVDQIKRVDRDLSKLRASGGNLVAEGAIIADVQEQEQDG